MPVVNGKHFGYGTKGKKAAKKYAKKTGKKVKHKKNPGYYVENTLGDSLWNTYKNLALVLEKNWIQSAVNPAHKGFCTPMTKKTCTPRRKALAKRFKKAGRKEKKSGGTGWQGKV